MLTSNTNRNNLIIRTLHKIGIFLCEFKLLYLPDLLYIVHTYEKNHICKISVIFRYILKISYFLKLTMVS